MNNLSKKQKEFFKPNKAAKWKDWIVDRHFQGMTSAGIHKKLLEEFPEAADVGVCSVRSIVAKVKHSKNKKGNKKNKTDRLNKSEEIRKLASEMRGNGVEVKTTNIIKTLANRGISVSYTHVLNAMGQMALDKTIPSPNKSEQQNSTNQIPFVAGLPKCNFDELVMAKEFVDKLGGIDNALNALSSYEKIIHKAQ